MLCRNICNRGTKTLLQTVFIPRTPFCAASSELYGVKHDRERQCFTVQLENEEEPALLKYGYQSQRHVLLLSTVVPESYRGRGVASLLAKAALDFVVEEQLSASIYCWYIQKYIDENPHNGYQAHIED